MADRDDRHDGQALLEAAARARGGSSVDLQPRSALDGVAPGPRGPWTPWNITALVTGLLLIAGSLASLNVLPKAQRFSAVTVRFTDGPAIPDAEVLAWIRTFPFTKQLNQPNEYILHQLAEHLRTWTAVADVPQVRLVHQRGPVPVVRRDPKTRKPVRATIEGVRRVLEVTLSLRQPYLPGVLEDGRRVWIDREGRVLPGILPRPEVQRPVIRAIRAGGPEALAHAARLWALLEPQIAPGLITDIVLSEPLDVPVATNPADPTAVAAAAAPAPRGIVLRMRTGGRILWGAPGEERFGVSADDKAANLLHTLRCQGDLTRLAMVNVRFREPTYSLR